MTNTNDIFDRVFAEAAAAALGGEHGAEAADVLAREGASGQELARLARQGNDWGVSASESWHFAARRSGMDPEDSGLREAYVDAFETSARQRAEELAEELAE